MAFAIGCGLNSYCNYYFAHTIQIQIHIPTNKFLFHLSHFGDICFLIEAINFSFLHIIMKIEGKLDIPANAIFANSEYFKR